MALKGLIPLIWLQSKISPVQFFVTCLVALLSWFIFQRSLQPEHFPGEPPIIKPRIPLISHLWGLLRSQVNYFSELYSETKLPIATLPILNQKLYVIFDPVYQQAALKSKDMDAQSFMVDFVPRIFGVKQGTVDKLLGKDGVHPNIMSDMEGVFNHALSGARLQKLVETTLEDVGKTLNGINNKEGGLAPPNLFAWFQNLLTKATSTALWGENHNPYHDQDVIDAQWEFESNMDPLVIGLFPKIIARKAYLARAKLQGALEPFYRAKHDQNDPSVSAFVRNRSQLLRKYDLPDDELAKNEIAITLVATTNALSTLFWCVAEIFTRPDLLTEVSKEVHNAVFSPESRKGTPSSKNKIVVSINARDLLEEHCPLLNSCYREAIRLASQIVTARRVLRDMELSPSGKKSYLMKAGTNVMMPAKVVHRDPSIWGDDAEEFNPRRFLPPTSDDDVEGAARYRRMRNAFVPFGGGKHLCPGRHYAFMENLSIMAALVLGFEIEGLDKDRLKMGDSKRGETAKPLPGLEGGEVVIKRREGWEDVEWVFRCE
ncbi:Cytochrome P450 [Naviculisporaceae sp. PSN 640]